MNRDKAIEIAAKTMGLHDYDDHKWASAVVARADALLAAMGEPTASMLKSLQDFQRVQNDEITRRARGMADVNAKPAPIVCCNSGECAATEARVVAEIAAWCRRTGGTTNWISVPIERGDWRAKEIR